MPACHPFARRIWNRPALRRVSSRSLALPRSCCLMSWDYREGETEYLRHRVDDGFKHCIARVRAFSNNHWPTRRLIDRGGMFGLNRGHVQPRGRATNSEIPVVLPNGRGHRWRTSAAPVLGDVPLEHDGDPRTRGRNEDLLGNRRLLAHAWYKLITLILRGASELVSMLRARVRQGKDGRRCADSIASLAQWDNGDQAPSSSRVRRRRVMTCSNRFTRA